MAQSLQVALVVERTDVLPGEEGCDHACDGSVRCAQRHTSSTEAKKTQRLHGGDVNAVSEVDVVHVVLEDAVGEPNVPQDADVRGAGHNHAEGQ